MDLTRRGFLKGAGALSASTLLVRQATVFGAEQNEAGLFVPTEPEVLIATEMPVESSIASFSMYVTEWSIRPEFDNRIEVTSILDNSKQYIQGLNDYEVNIRGHIISGVNWENIPMNRNSVMVHMTQASK